MNKKRSARFYRTEYGKEPAKEWLDSLRDTIGQAKIWIRIRMAEMGNFGDCKRVGEGVSELRIRYGPGYRVYFGLDVKGDLIVLLMGGKKSSQRRDIEKAKSFWKNYKKGDKK